MKKTIKIASIVFGIVLVVLLALPFAFHGQIERIVKQQGDRLLQVDFDFSELDISLLRHFPHATVSLSQLYVQGSAPFQNDTLLKADELSATVNLFSLFGSRGYEINRVLIRNTHLQAKVDKNGESNWNVLKSSQHNETSQSPATEASPNDDSSADAFRILLQKFEVDNLSVSYDDRQTDLYVALHNLQSACEGDFASDASLLKLQLQSPSLTYRSAGVPLLNRVSIATDIDLQADFKQGRYTLENNRLSVNAVELGVDGWVTQLADGFDMDLKLKSGQVAFKDLLSLVPALYVKDFETLQANGNVVLSAFAKGKLQGRRQFPAFRVDLSVDDAHFRYPALPAGVEDIRLHLLVQNPGGSPDSTTLRLYPFHLSLGQHPLDVEARLKTPVTDPDFWLKAKGHLDLGKIKDVYPLETMQLEGIVDADVALSGQLSSIEKEQYEKLYATGNVSLKGLLLRMQGLPLIEVKHSDLAFSPRYVALKKTTVHMGQNDLTFDSRLENYVGYFLKGTTLRGDLNVTSDFLCLSDFLTADTDTVAVTAVEDTLQMSPNTASGGILRIPANLDFTVRAHMQQVVLQNMKFHQVRGQLFIKDSKVDMQNLSMQTMGGNVVMNGAYATPVSHGPILNAGFAVSNLSFAQAYQELGMVRSLAPVFKELKGEFSGNIKVDTDLDNQMQPVLETTHGSGFLSTKDLSLSHVKFIDQVATIVNKPSLKELKVNNLRIDFTIDKGRVYTQPFDLQLGDYRMNLSGSTGLDQTIDYKGKITLPASSGDRVRLSTVDMNIGGTFNSPKVSIDMASVAKNLAGQLLNDLLGSKSEAKGDSAQPKKKNLFGKVKDLFKKK